MDWPPVADYDATWWRHSPVRESITAEAITGLAVVTDNSTRRTTPIYSTTRLVARCALDVGCYASPEAADRPPVDNESARLASVYLTDREWT